MLKPGHCLGDPFCCAHARSNDVFFHRPSDVLALVSQIEVYFQTCLNSYINLKKGHVKILKRLSLSLTVLNFESISVTCLPQSA